MDPYLVSEPFNFEDPFSFGHASALNMDHTAQGYPTDPALCVAASQVIDAAAAAAMLRNNRERGTTVTDPFSGQDLSVQKAVQSHVPVSHSSSSVRAGRQLLVPIPQTQYLRGPPAIYHFEPISFGAFSLQSAIHTDYGGLQDAERLAWSEPDLPVCPKMSVVFCFTGYPVYSHQVTVLRARSKPPTLGKLANLVAREMEIFLMARNGSGRAFQYDGRELTLKDLCL